MPARKIDHLLEQLELAPDSAADDDALPYPGPQRRGDDRRHIVAAVKAEQARFDAERVISESRYSHLDRVGYRPGVPGPGPGTDRGR